jgi:hypothetical protein
VLAPKCGSGSDEQVKINLAGANLGAFIDDALAHLACLSKDASCGGGKYLSPRRAKEDIQRHYLMAHSGGAHVLSQAAVSDYAFAKPTFLVLLDSQYGYYGAKNGLNPKNPVQRFVEYWAGQGKLGIGDDQSRVLIVSGIKSDTNDETDNIRASLEASHHSVFQIGKPKEGKRRGERAPFPPDERQSVLDALKQNAIVLVWTPVSHDDIPTYFVPVALEAG